MQRSASTRFAIALTTGAVLSLGAVSAQADIQPGNYQDHVVPQQHQYQAQPPQPDRTPSTRTNNDAVQAGNYQDHRVPDPSKFQHQSPVNQTARQPASTSEKYASDAYQRAQQRSAMPNN